MMIIHHITDPQWFNNFILIIKFELIFDQK